MAPEVVDTANEGYSFAADWWSCGILLYEMVIGDVPFASQNTHKLQQSIMNSPVKWPKSVEVSDDFKELVEKLLTKNPNDRIGASDGADEILAHDWFSDTDLDLIEQRDPECVLPYKPSPNAMENFTLKQFNGELTESVVTAA